MLTTSYTSRFKERHPSHRTCAPLSINPSTFYLLLPQPTPSTCTLVPFLSNFFKNFKPACLSFLCTVSSSLFTESFPSIHKHALYLLSLFPLTPYSPSALLFLTATRPKRVSYTHFLPLIHSQPIPNCHHPTMPLKLFSRISLGGKVNSEAWGVQTLCILKTEAPLIGSQEVPCKPLESKPLECPIW